MDNQNLFTITLGTTLNARARAALIGLIDSVQPDGEQGREPNSIAEEVKRSVERTRLLATGTRFSAAQVCDLPKFSSGERKVLGREYRRAVEGAQPPVAKHIGRSKDRHAIYEKI
jgi:hypothetical protein